MVLHGEKFQPYGSYPLTCRAPSTKLICSHHKQSKNCPSFAISQVGLLSWEMSVASLIFSTQRIHHYNLKVDRCSIWSSCFLLIQFFRDRPRVITKDKRKTRYIQLRLILLYSSSPLFSLLVFLIWRASTRQNKLSFANVVNVLLILFQPNFCCKVTPACLFVCYFVCFSCRSEEALTQR